MRLSRRGSMCNNGAMQGWKSRALPRKPRKADVCLWLERRTTAPGETAVLGRWKARWPQDLSMSDTYRIDSNGAPQPVRPCGLKDQHSSTTPTRNDSDLATETRENRSAEPAGGTSRHDIPSRNRSRRLLGCHIAILISFCPGLGHRDTAGPCNV